MEIIFSQDKIVYEPAKLNESTKHFNKSQNGMKIKSFLFKNDFFNVFFNYLSIRSIRSKKETFNLLFNK
jgi:hypothetical protein